MQLEVQLVLKQIPCCTWHSTMIALALLILLLLLNCETGQITTGATEVERFYFYSYPYLQVVFSSNEDLEVGDQQTSLISTTEEVIQEEEVAVEDNTSEQQFGVFKDFDFLDVELEDAEVRPWDFFCMFPFENVLKIQLCWCKSKELAALLPNSIGKSL